MDKITYANKVDTRTTTDPEINKVTASTLNEVKTIVNETVDQVVLNLNELSNNVVKTTGNQSIAGDKTFTNDLAAPKLNFGYNTYYGRDMTISGIGDGTFDGIEVTNEFIIGKLANGTGDTALYFKYGSERVGGIYLDDDSSQHGLAFYVQESSTNSDIVKKISLREGTTIGNGLASTLPPENGLAVEGAATFASSVTATDGIFSGDLALGGTGQYTTNQSLNIDGTGLAIKNDVNGSDNNWSIIHNTAGAGRSNLVFGTGAAAAALTLANSGAATFSSSVSAEKVYIGVANTDVASLSVEGSQAGVVDIWRNGSNASFEAIRFRNSTNSGTEASIGYNTNQLRFNTNGVNALTLNSDQSATFASSVSATDGIFSGDIIANQNIYTNGNLLQISAGGNGATVIQINDSQGKFTLNGKVEVESLSVSSLNTAPASATATGTTGQIKYTEDYIYVCTATNTWKRTAITTW